MILNQLANHKGKKHVKSGSYSHSYYYEYYDTYEYYEKEVPTKELEKFKHDLRKKGWSWIETLDVEGCIGSWGT